MYLCEECVWHQRVWKHAVASSLGEPHGTQVWTSFSAARGKRHNTERCAWVCCACRLAPDCSPPLYELPLLARVANVVGSVALNIVHVVFALIPRPPFDGHVNERHNLQAVIRNTFVSDES